MKDYIAAVALLCCPLPILAMSGASAAQQHPQIIAHRAGTTDAPENTDPAVEMSLKNGADAVWITLQLSKDGIPVLYRPSDLKALTDLSGPVSGKNAADLANANASYDYDKKHNIKRQEHVGIPRLAQILKDFPHTFFYLDIKSPDADPQTFAKALHDVLQKNQGLNRTRVYSTDDKYLDALPEDIQRFESRNKTRTMLANITMAHKCEMPTDTQNQRWYGLEMKREVEVVEKYTLGEGRSKAVLSWDKEAMDCFRSQGNAHIILFGINTKEDYQQAKALGADGVLVNSPALFKTINK